MSLLNPSINPAQVAANQVLYIIQSQFQQLARSGQQGFNVIWNNPNASPTDIIAALGTSAAAVFQLAGLNIQTVQAAATIGGTTPPSIPSVPAQYVLTFNQDGSATVSMASSSSAGA